MDRSIQLKHVHHGAAEVPGHQPDDQERCTVADTAVGEHDQRKDGHSPDERCCDHTDLQQCTRQRSTGQHQQRHAKPGTACYAENAGSCQRIAEKGLHHEAAGGERATCTGGGNGLWQAHFANDPHMHWLGTLAVQQCSDHLGQGDAGTTEQQVQQEQGCGRQHQDHEQQGLPDGHRANIVVHLRNGTRFALLARSFAVPFQLTPLINPMLRGLVILACTLALSGCYSVRKSLREADLLEQQGALEEAFAAYNAIDDHRPGNADARRGIQRSAQRLFDRLQDGAGSSYMVGDYPAGEQKRIDAEMFRDRMHREGIAVQWSTFFEARRTEARDMWLEGLYQQAEAAFKMDRFQEAGSITARILQHDPDHANAEHLLRMARNEPKYRDGKRAFDIGRFTDAVRILGEVVSEDPYYKDALSLHHVAMNKASYTLAYLIVPGNKPGRFSRDTSPKPSKDEVLLAGVMEQAIVQLDDPLVQLIDRNHTDALLAEQLRALTGGVEESTAAQAGKLLGAQFVFTGQVLHMDEDRVDLRVTLIDASTGRIHMAEQVSALRSEVGRVRDPKPLLMTLATQRAAEHLKEFDRFDD